MLVNGKDLTRMSVRKRSVAFVYQQFINYPSLTVYENIASPLRLDPRFRRDGVDRRVREVAELMGIENLLRRRPAELSGGQQQRTAIARALARPVDLLLLDEPLANLDFKLREQLRADLKSMFAGSPGVVLYATADPAEALTFAAPTVVLGEGRVRHVGDVADMYARPPTLAVAATLSDPPLNVLPGVVRDGRVEVLGTGGEQEVVLGVRPPPGDDRPGPARRAGTARRDQARRGDGQRDVPAPASPGRPPPGRPPAGHPAVHARRDHARLHRSGPRPRLRQGRPAGRHEHGGGGPAWLTSGSTAWATAMTAGRPGR
ncbi:hypothetical protein GCM10020001_064310 [Nonomuraea salmonea]